LSKSFSKARAITPKGVVSSLAISASGLVFRQALSSACQVSILALGFLAIAKSLAEVVVAVGSIDLVVGELDR